MRLPYYVLPHFASARPCVALLSVAVAQLHRVAPLIAFTMNAARNAAFFELPSFYCPPLHGFSPRLSASTVL